MKTALLFFLLCASAFAGPWQPAGPSSSLTVTSATGYGVAVSTTGTGANAYTLGVTGSNTPAITANGTTNPILSGTLTGATILSVATTGTTYLPITGEAISECVLTASAGSGAYTSNVVLSDTNTTASTNPVYLIKFIYPASTNPTVNFYNGTVGAPTLLNSFTNTLGNSGTTEFIAAVVTGTNWTWFNKGAVLNSDLASGVKTMLALSPNTAGGAATYPTSGGVTNGASTSPGISFAVSGSTGTLSGTTTALLAATGTGTVVLTNTGAVFSLNINTGTLSAITGTSNYVGIGIGTQPPMFIGGAQGNGQVFIGYASATAANAVLTDRAQIDIKNNCENGLYMSDIFPQFDPTFNGDFTGMTAGNGICGYVLKWSILSSGTASTASQVAYGAYNAGVGSPSNGAMIFWPIIAAGIPGNTGLVNAYFGANGDTRISGTVGIPGDNGYCLEVQGNGSSKGSFAVTGTSSSGQFTLATGAASVVAATTSTNSVIQVSIAASSGSAIIYPSIVCYSGSFTVTGAATDTSTYNWWKER